MEDLLRKGTYNSGRRPSEHYIGQRSFLKDNRGAIPPNVLIPPALETFAPLNFLSFANTATNDPYQVYCRANGIRPHPARMQPKLAEFFIEFLTDEEELIMDSFAGSNTTGAMAEKLNRKWLSTELDSAYVNASRTRFAMLRLFTVYSIINRTIAVGTTVVHCVQSGSQWLGCYLIAQISVLFSCNVVINALILKLYGYSFLKMVFSSPEAKITQAFRSKPTNRVWFLGSS